MNDPETGHVVLVTGPSGAGRSTAIKALEDIGFEVIDNLPLSLIDRLIGAPNHGPDHPLALGLDVRNRDFSAGAILRLLNGLDENPKIKAEMLYVDAAPEVLLRRYSETRRRHPLAPDGTPEVGISQEIILLDTLRERAETLIDTSDFTPHDLRAEISRLFARDGSPGMALSVQSFSYKRGVPHGVDLVFDTRYLRNPHWDPGLRDMDGRDADVLAYIAEDALFTKSFDQIADLLLTLLPAYVHEGKTHLTVAFGCTGGQHRSVAVAEKLAKHLVKKGWRVSTRHRELERRAVVAGRPSRGR